MSGVDLVGSVGAGPLVYAIVCLAAAAAAGLTFFSGFGLGTLLLPVFACFFPVERAVALTAVVHFTNGLLKVALVGRHADRRTVIRFGLPALLAAVAGAWTLERLAAAAPLATYAAFGRTLEVTPVKFVIGLMLLGFAILDLVPGDRRLTFAPALMPLGGLVSGFCGGLSGMQGALRAAFLTRAGLAKEAFVATGAVVACLVDVSRLGVYAAEVRREWATLDTGLLAAAVLAALAGTLGAGRLLPHVTLAAVQRVVAGLLVAVGLGLAAGIL